MNLTIRCCTNTTIAIVFLTTSCYSSVTLADYIKPTPECAQAQQQLKILEGRMKDDEQIVTNAQATYENVAEGVTQVDHTNVDALRQYIANKEQAFQSYMPS